MPSRISKIRIDQWLVENNLTESRQKAQALIIAKKIFLGEQLIHKTDYLVEKNAKILVKEEPLFVSRGGDKLNFALTKFAIKVHNKVVLDVGASTGGFSDCLLQKGAKKVFALDVGSKQLHWKLQKEKRIVSIENTNFRKCHFEIIGELVDLIVIDVSFISVKLLVEKLALFLKPKKDLIVLFKPQFEVGRKHIMRGGKVKDTKAIMEALEDLCVTFSESSFKKIQFCESPIRGKKASNKEYLIHFKNESIYRRTH